MNNRTLYTMTALVLLGIAVLFWTNIKSIIEGKPLSQTYLNYNEVRGVAVQYKGKPYTLNFEQQNQFIDYVNRFIPIEKIESKSDKKPDFDSIIVYQFNNQPDITFKPVAFNEQNLIFSVPLLQKDGYLMDISEGKLNQFISKTHDS